MFKAVRAPLIFMITDIFLTAMAIAGAMVVWRELLVQSPVLKNRIFKYVPFPVNKAITCGFCATFWSTLLVVVFFDPLRGWFPQLRFDLPFVSGWPIQLAFSWMALGGLAVFFRFLIVLVHERVHTELRRNKS